MTSPCPQIVVERHDKGEYDPSAYWEGRFDPPKQSEYSACETRIRVYDEAGWDTFYVEEEERRGPFAKASNCWIPFDISVLDEEYRALYEACVAASRGVDNAAGARIVLSMAMTISQALRQVKKLKGELATHKERATRSLSYKEDEPPAFPFKASLEALTAARTELVKLETAIALTNAKTVVKTADGQISLTGAAKSLQALKAQIAWLRELSPKAHPTTVETSSEYSFDAGKHFQAKTTWKCDMPEAERDAQIAKAQANFDALNDAVERANHSTEIVSV